MDFKLTREQEDLQERVRALVRRKIAPRAAEYDRDGRFPRENFEDLHKANLLGLLIPQEYGGLGADMLTYTLIIDELARGCGSTALIYAMHCGATRAAECVKHGETHDDGANGLLKKDYSRNGDSIDGSAGPTGRLIHTACGTRGGRGVPRTKRSGWVA